ncbi:MAG: hypothetical protein CME62_16830 [Halobacteriovoraceae bacterium]|nr:hypothetical protein [Halobacteriovoraceae bacterium]|tara:strand:- start:8680 stop:9615 length:936 start_codon:yes stop_codon:yes gene_type:complete
MKVDHVLILAAGKGTRMGTIGQKLPKVLWPVFEKSIIELEILYAQSLAPDAKIYINTYYHKDIILNELEKLKTKYSFQVIEEKQPLDIGGAIHNLASQLNYSGNLLVINSDQFLFFSKSKLDQALEQARSNDVILFGYDVNSSSMYNGLDVKNNQLQGIVANEEIPRDKVIQTYSGISLIKLQNLKEHEGHSKFFETVANPKLSRVSVINLSQLEYWDFGTIKRYYKSMFDLLKQNEQKSQFFKFLFESKSIDKKKLTSQGYGTTTGINLSDIMIENAYQSIVLKLDGPISVQKDVREIIWKGDRILVEDV